VVENVERNIASGLSPRLATIQAMKEVSGPIIAIALVLCAVFVPIAFVSGLTGQFYRQFALTIAISTVISAFNSLTLSPALAAIMLRSRDAPKDWLTRAMERVFGGFFRWFDHLFHRSSEAYGRRVTGILGRKALALGIYAVLLGLTYVLFVRRYAQAPTTAKEREAQLAYLAGGGGLNWASWQLASITGIVLANSVPLHWGLGFAGILALTGVACSLATSTLRRVSAGVAGSAAVAAFALPFKLNIAFAIAVAVALSLLLERTPPDRRSVA